ncbi:MAG: 4-hydroxy-tetrahydrodipicolinate reductase [Planctomycetota bacterium]
MSEPSRVLVNGAAGRMGRLAVDVVNGADDLVLAGETDAGDDLAGAIASSGAGVVVDFTHHSVAMDCFRAIVLAGARPVAGTSGFGPDEVEEARRLLEEAGTGGLIIPNFCVGVVLMMEFARAAAAHFPHVEIVETHHDRKGDAPSGTAERTAQIIAEVRGDPPAPRVEETERVEGARGGRVDGVPVHSLRLPGALAHQEVLFSATGEIFTLRHDSLSRDSFRTGILLAVRHAPEARGLVHGLDDLL